MTYVVLSVLGAIATIGLILALMARSDRKASLPHPVIQDRVRALLAELTAPEAEADVVKGLKLSRDDTDLAGKKCEMLYGDVRGCSISILRYTDAPPRFGARRSIASFGLPDTTAFWEYSERDPIATAINGLIQVVGRYTERGKEPTVETAGAGA
jgi:hypothetical protein